MPRIVYSPHYNIGLLGIERLHPFDSRKYGRAWRLLRRELGRQALRRMWVRPRREVSREELLAVHTPEYLEKLRDPLYVARALEVPLLARLPMWALDRYVLRPMRWATHGTMIAAREALQHGLAINLGGGYHHAKPDRGEGFCIYNDIALASLAVRREGLIAEDARILYVDLDAHQGNGVSHAMRDDLRFFIFDMFHDAIYPAYDLAARERIDCAIPLPGNTTDTQYMEALTTRLPGFVDSLSSNGKVALAIYNAGTDIVAGDPLGLMNISADTILERDLFVVRTLRQRGIPTAMVLSGGYTRESYKLVARSVARLLTTP
jgi:histone deacetylase 11